MAADEQPAGTAHIIDPDHFAALASGGGDHHVVATLWRSERSWRLVSLLNVIESCLAHGDVTGPLAPIDEVWELLVTASRARPDVTEDVLARPQIGIWAAHTLRRLEGRVDTVESLWADVGYLHSLTAAIAIRAGVPFELDVPVRHGTAVFPTIGSAMLPPTTTCARVRAANAEAAIHAGNIAIRIGQPNDGWHPAIVISIDHGDVPLRVELHDLDFYRGLRGPSSPRPVDWAEVSRWRQLVGDAWGILTREQPERARSIAQSLRALAPMPAQEPFRQTSASGAEAFGGVLLSMPDDATQLAATLVHESQHHKLHALIHMLTLTTENPAVGYYAPWRDDPRPISGLLQGAYAFAGITQFWRSHRLHAPPSDLPLTDVEFCLWRRQTHLALRTLAGSGRLSEHGTRFVEILVAEVEKYLDEPVPAEAEAAANMIIRDHWAMWRSHNLRLSAPVAADLVEAWRRGRTPVIPSAEGRPDGPGAIAEPDRIWFDGRAVLTRYRVGRPDDFAALRADPDLIGRRVDGATVADLHLVAGDRVIAAAGYLKELASDPTDVHGWVGLGLTRTHPDDPVARALLGRPELVLTVVRKVGAANPIALATWIGEALAEDDVLPAGPAGWSLIRPAGPRRSQR